MSAVALAALFASVAGAIARRKAPPGSVNPASEVRGATVHVAPAPSSIMAIAPRPATFPGVVVARRSAEVAPTREGRLMSVNVRLGDRVPAGGLIGTLDARMAQFDAAMAEATLKTAQFAADGAEVEVGEAGENASRLRALSEEKLATGEDLSKALYQERSSKLRAESMRAQANEKRVHFEQLVLLVHEAEIVAPFEGVVVARYVSPGAVVTPSTPVVRLISADDLIVRFAASESYAKHARVGRPVLISRGQGEPAVGGVVESVAPEIDPLSRTVVAEARFDVAAVRAWAPVAGEVVRVSWQDAP